jgi:predicted lipoprotein with Yx(FWY)xxD motif
VVLVDTQANASDGDYFVASGEVSVGMPEGAGNTSFTGQMLDRAGFSLYTFANDTAGVSNCSGNCLVNWPPLLANPGDQASAPYSIIERSMGTAANALQWAYHGKPLYFFKNDTVAGQTAGKAIPNWLLARPMPTQVVANATLGSHLAAAGRVKLAMPVSGTEQTSSAERNGFTLYTFDMDTTGVSNCSGTCLTNWPALIAHAGAVASAPYSLVQRASGEMQWALNGLPLYFFAGDTQAGQTNGEAVGTNWFVARTPSVAVNNHSTKNRLLVAHGNIVNAAGALDNSRLDFTLYTFDDDTPGVTTCFGGCLAAWPALYAPADAQAFGDFSVIVRDVNTGVKQWAYKGLPLYFYVGDGAPGDVAGEYTDWTIARP